MSQHGITRRAFIQHTTVAAAGIAAGTVPGFAIAQSKSPNSKLNVAAIGCGGMGFGDTCLLYTSDAADE